VLGEAAEPFDPNRGAAALTERLEFLSVKPEHCENLGALAYQRAEENFSWKAVVGAYEKLFDEILPCQRSR